MKLTFYYWKPIHQAYHLSLHCTFKGKRIYMSYQIITNEERVATALQACTYEEDLNRMGDTKPIVFEVPELFVKSRNINLGKLIGNHAQLLTQSQQEPFLNPHLTDQALTSFFQDISNRSRAMFIGNFWQRKRNTLSVKKQIEQLCKHGSPNATDYLFLFLTDSGIELPAGRHVSVIVYNIFLMTLGFILVKVIAAEEAAIYGPVPAPSNQPAPAPVGERPAPSPNALEAAKTFEFDTVFAVMLVFYGLIMSIASGVGVFCYFIKHRNFSFSRTPDYLFHLIKQHISGTIMQIPTSPRGLGALTCISFTIFTLSIPTYIALAIYETIADYFHFISRPILTAIALTSYALLVTFNTIAYVCPKAKQKYLEKQRQLGKKQPLLSSYNNEENDLTEEEIQALSRQIQQQNTQQSLLDRTEASADLSNPDLALKLFYWPPKKQGNCCKSKDFGHIGLYYQYGSAKNDHNYISYISAKDEQKRTIFKINTFENDQDLMKNAKPLVAESLFRTFNLDIHRLHSQHQRSQIRFNNPETALTHDAGYNLFSRHCCNDAIATNQVWNSCCHDLSAEMGIHTGLHEGPTSDLHVNRILRDGSANCTSYVYALLVYSGFQPPDHVPGAQIFYGINCVLFAILIDFFSGVEIFRNNETSHNQSTAPNALNANPFTLFDASFGLLLGLYGLSIVLLSTVYSIRNCIKGYTFKTPTGLYQLAMRKRKTQLYSRLNPREFGAVSSLLFASSYLSLITYTVLVIASFVEQDDPIYSFIKPIFAFFTLSTYIALIIINSAVSSKAKQHYLNQRPCLKRLCPRSSREIHRTPTTQNISLPPQEACDDAVQTNIAMPESKL